MITVARDTHTILHSGSHALKFSQATTWIVVESRNTTHLSLSKQQICPSVIVFLWLKTWLNKYITENQQRLGQVLEVFLVKILSKFIFH